VPHVTVARAINLFRRHTSTDDTIDVLGPIPRNSFLQRLEVSWTVNAAATIQIMPSLSASPAAVLGNLQAGSPLLNRSNVVVDGVKAYQASPGSSMSGFVTFWIQQHIETGPMYVLVRIVSTSLNALDFHISMIPRQIDPIEPSPKRKALKPEEEPIDDIPDGPGGDGGPGVGPSRGLGTRGIQAK